MDSIGLNGIRQISINETGGNAANEESAYLTVNEYDELNQCIEQNKLERKFFVREVDNTLQIINYVGYIHLSTAAIEILPKFCRLDKKKAQEKLFEMVETVYQGGDEPITSATTISELNDSQCNWFELIASVFADKLKKGLMKGAVSAYVQVENNQPFLRGRLLISKHITNIVGTTGKAYCQYDEFSMDNMLNRILKQAVNLLIGKVGNAKTLNLLKFCLRCFADVDDIRSKVAELEKVKIDRTNHRFLAAFNLAKLLLAGRSTINAAGKSSSFALLFRMDDLFEKYITSVMKKCSKYEVIAQEKRYNLAADSEGNHKCFFIEPDIVVRQGSKELIIDTKWKCIGSQYGPAREDYFQMYVYLTRYNAADTGILLYPHMNGCDNEGQLKSYDLQGISHSVKNKRLLIYTINYENSVEDIQKKLEAMIETGLSGG